MQYANDAERLVAEQAVLNFPRVDQGVMKTAPHGKAMAVLEQAVREKGFEQMRQHNAGRHHDKAQEKGVNSRPCSCGRLGVLQGLHEENIVDSGGGSGSEPAVLLLPQVP